MGDRDSSGGVEDNAILDASLLKKHVSATKYKDLLDIADQAVTDIKNASKYVKIITVGDLRKVPDAFWTNLDPVLSAALKETFIQGDEHPPKKRHITTKNEILEVLEAYKPKHICQHNGVFEQLELFDEEDFTMIGAQLPFTGRDIELGELEDCLRQNVCIWQRWYATAKATENKQKVGTESGKRIYRHPAVAGGSGRGKTTLMTRGVMKVLWDHFPDSYSERSFLWDLDEQPLTETERELFLDLSGGQNNISGAQTVLALRIFHQAINNHLNYTVFLTDLKKELAKHHATIADLTLDIVLDHITEAGAVLDHSETFKLPKIVALHLSETNILLQSAPYMELQLIMKASYQFNKGQASMGGHYMLVTTFDGTDRMELLEAFLGSGVQPCMITFAPVDSGIYTTLLRSLAQKAVEGGLVSARGLEELRPSTLLKATLSNCADVLRLFALLIYAIGCYNSGQSLFAFSWSQFFANLKMYSNNGLAIAAWEATVHDLVLQHFPKYIDMLMKFEPIEIFRIVVPSLLGTPIPATRVLFWGKYTWEDLEKNGVISIRGQGRKLIDMPFMFITIYLERLRNAGYSYLRFLHLIHALHSESDPRQNEKCDAVMLALRLINWHFNHPSATRFRISDILPVEGDTAKLYLQLPQEVADVEFLHAWPTMLHHYFDPRRDLVPGAYIGCGNDPFWDSWFSFIRVDCAAKVVLGIESKRREDNQIVSTEYFREHKKKGTDKLETTTAQSVFMFVADMRGEDVTVRGDEILIHKDNMQELYGKWLAQRRMFALSKEL